MNVDNEVVAAARAFLAGNGRLLDRQRFQVITGTSDGAHAVLAALQAYRNADGGYGWGIEPDLRSPESQPLGAMHAFEVLAEIGPATSPVGVELCDWLASVTLDDGSLPLTLPITDPSGSSPVWLDADPTQSSLQMTAQVAANALRVARHDDGVASHAWLARAAGWCSDYIASLDAAPVAHELMFAARFVDALAGMDRGPVEGLLERLARFIPSDGTVPVAGGAADEALRPLDLVTHPESVVRQLLAHDAVTADLDRLAKGQDPDGGWTVDFSSSSPAATLEWRGYTTVSAVAVLLASWDRV
jgi:hypothetical protein